MKTGQAIITTALVCLASVTAAPMNPVGKRDIDPQFSPFAKCMQGKIQGFPTGGRKPNPDEVTDCLKQIGAMSLKRSVTMNQSRNKDEGMEGRSTLENRDILETVFKAGADLTIDQKPFCDGDKVHDNFLWVTDIRDNAVGVCQELSQQIQDGGIKEDGGVGILVKKFTDGHDKQANELRDNRKVTATFLLNFIPPAKISLDKIKEIASGVDELCQNAVTKIATKGMGCSADIKYYRPSKARSYTGTGAIGGFLEMLWGKDKENSVANLSVDFSNDG